LKEWRAVATRYAKTSASYLAACQIRALALWIKLL
ncbi:MAG: IS5/IS1182 family transposase, partial [Chloroflexi bacterium]|nr:IS5/IS1182 family transposase [Chloroflexota bacterium]